MNFHIYPSTFTNETRILKIVRSLHHASLFSSISVLALWKHGLPRQEVIEDGIQVIRVAPIIGERLGGRLGSVIKALGWYLGILLVLKGRRVTCFNCHSLLILPLALLIKLWKGCVLIYDPHELETEKAGLHGVRQSFARTMERCLIGFADAVCVVNRSIANWYVAQYRLKNVWVVRNVPNRNEMEPVRTGLLRQAAGLGPDAQIFLYQGLLSLGRGVALLIEVFSELSQGQHLVFMGYGELEGEIREAAARYANIHFIPAVPPEQVKDFTVDADVGVSLIENVCLSYYLCLPNKLFEYAAYGVPALVSDFPEMADFVDECNCGWKVTPSPDCLRELILRLTPEEIASKRANTRASRELYCWAEEEKALLTMYQELGFGFRRSA